MGSPKRFPRCFSPLVTCGAFLRPTPTLHLRFKRARSTFLHLYLNHKSTPPEGRTRPPFGASLPCKRGAQNWWCRDRTPHDPPPSGRPRCRGEGRRLLLLGRSRSAEGGDQASRWETNPEVLLHVGGAYCPP